MSALAKNVVWTLSFSNLECYTRDVGVACTNCNVCRRANKKYTNKSVKRFLRNLTDVGMEYWLTKYTNKGYNDMMSASFQAFLHQWLPVGSLTCISGFLRGD